MDPDLRLESVTMCKKRNNIVVTYRGKSVKQTKLLRVVTSSPEPS